jgi:hypothetical protein
MHEEESQGKEVYNWKEEAGSSEWWYLSTLCHITPKKTVVFIFTTVRTWVLTYMCLRAGCLLVKVAHRDQEKKKSDVRHHHESRDNVVTTRIRRSLSPRIR